MMEGYSIEIPDLVSFVVPNVHPTGRELGKGAYGIVEEVEIPGAVCAAKKIHTEFLNIGSHEDISHMITKFASECRLMSMLRHPHIVQFIGVCYLPGARLPSLVMERLDTNLHDLLETIPNLPLAVKNSVLLDTARGLLYLHSHSPPIIHRDLTARNVLLNSTMVAKIADLGVARIVNLQPDQIATMTQGPGNIIYMPPEAMGEHTQYNTSLDIFSFGNISLFTLTQEFIGSKLKAATYTDDVGKINARSEIERREYGFCIIYRDLGKENALAQLTRACLQNHPTYRPNAADLVERIKVISSDNMVLPSKFDLMKQLSSKEEESKEMADQIKLLQDMMSSQQLMLQTQSSTQQREIEIKDTQLTELQKVVHTQEEQIQGFKKRLADMLAQVTPLCDFQHFINLRRHRFRYIKIKTLVGIHCMAA
jgi:serine/threonine protein kinase